MKKYWKQFEEWATALKADPLIGVKIKLGFLYLAIAIAIFSIESEFIDSRIKNANLQNWIFFSVVSSILIPSYFLTIIALRPIRNIIRAQKRFLADASHELRTPLSIIKTNSEIALLDGPDLKNSEAILMINSNIEEIDRMSKIIENLLSLSYYENRITNIEFKPLDFSNLVHKLVDRYRNLAAKKSISLEVKKESVVIQGNEVAIEQMVINLLKNAITYTSPGGKIDVYVRSRNGNGSLKIRDNGIGIDSKDLPYIFDPFYKNTETKEYNKGTSGLGLTIVKKIIERHKGTIEINSKLGRGTLVSVCLPGINKLS